MRMLSHALSAACLIASAALAQTAPPPPPAAPTITDAKPASPDDDALICIDQDPDPSSRLIPRRVCHTREEWNKLNGKGR